MMAEDLMTQNSVDGGCPTLVDGIGGFSSIQMDIIFFSGGSEDMKSRLGYVYEYTLLSEIQFISTRYLWCSKLLARENKYPLRSRYELNIADRLSFRCINSY